VRSSSARRIWPRRSTDPGPASPVQVEQAQRLSRGRRLDEGRLQAAPADAEAPLGQRAREVERDQLDLAAARGAQQLGQQRDLGGLARRRAHLVDARDQLVESERHGGVPDPNLPAKAWRVDPAQAGLRGKRARTG
jgi:hypothetical protein